jgi:hypothetical protein
MCGWPLQVGEPRGSVCVVQRLCAAILLAALGCVGLPPDPPLHDDDSTRGTTAETEGVDPSSSGPQVLDSTGPQSSDTIPSDTESTTTASGSPLLSVKEGPIYDFGVVATSSQIAVLFTVTNAGDGEATGLDAVALVAPFMFPGGFPGAGTCGSSLAAGDSCSLEVAFAPTEVGLHTGTLAVTHDQGPEATCDLAGGGAGQSPNLLVNPGGESAGTPPPGWSNVGPGSWVSGAPSTNVLPFEGAHLLAADEGPNDLDFVLQQDVAVGAWAASIDEDVLRFSFQGYARSLLANNNDHLIRVQYIDAGGAALATWDTAWVGTPSWQAYSDQRIAPANTRTVRVELLCRKLEGATCDAFFDALDLHAQYP